MKIEIELKIEDQYTHQTVWHLDLLTLRHGQAQCQQLQIIWNNPDKHDGRR